MCRETARRPNHLVQVDGRQASASAFSPDGKWLAYASTETGTWGVFVQPFPPTGAKYQLTTQSSSTPIWSSDVRQLFYVYTNRVFRADVRTDQGVSLGPATELDTAGSHPSLPDIRHLDVMPDGKRLLVILPEGAETTAQSPQINVVLNRMEELKQRATPR